MQLSPVNRHSSSKWSPDGRMIAVVNMQQVTLRDTRTFKTISSFVTCGKIERMDWASNSQHFLCMLSKKRALMQVTSGGFFGKSQSIIMHFSKSATVTVFSVANPKWQRSIIEDVVGISHARWTPDAQFIITTSEFGLRLAVWSLDSNETDECIPVAVIKRPKHSGKGIAFSNNKMFVATCVRENGKDRVEVHSCSKLWKKMQSFAVATKDTEDLIWAPEDTSIILWESPLKCRLLVYGINGVLFHVFEPYDNALGIRTVQFSPRKDVLAIGLHDGTARLLQVMDWSESAVFEHSRYVDREAHSVSVYKEEIFLDEKANHLFDIREVYGNQGPAIWDSEYVLESLIKTYNNEWTGCFSTTNESKYSNKKDETSDAGDNLLETSQEEVVAVPAARKHSKIQIPTVEFQPGLSLKTNAASVAPLKLGVSGMLWSPCGMYLATKNEEQPTAVWIWDTTRFSIVAILIHQNNVRHFGWDAHGELNGEPRRLAISTGDPFLYFWKLNEPFVLYTPSKELRCFRAEWNPCGGAILLQDKDTFCVAYDNGFW